MTALIYIICFFGAAVVQVLLRSLLASGAVPIIPGSVVIYLVALWAARKWSSSYKENKEMKKIQEELAAEHEDDSNKTM